MASHDGHWTSGHVSRFGRSEGMALKLHEPGPGSPGQIGHCGFGTEPANSADTISGLGGSIIRRNADFGDVGP